MIMVDNRRKSAGLSALVAAILLIAITVAAAVVVSGVFFNLAGIAGRRPSVIIDQVKLVARPNGEGTWAFVLKNTGDVPVAKIAAEFPSGCSPGSPTYAPNLSPGMTWGETEYVPAGSCQLGATYTLVLQIIFEDGSEQVLITQATAAIA